MHWYAKVLAQYADFRGRARRSEYWWFVVWNVIISLVIGYVDHQLLGDSGVPGTLYALLVLVPGLAVSVRRLHDTGRSGLWFLIGFVPCIGAIVLLVFFFTAGQRRDNEYGPDPKSMFA